MVALVAERFRRRQVLAWLAVPPVVGTVVFTAGWLIADQVQESYDARRDYLSTLAAVDATNPWIIISALMVFGVGVISLGAGLAFSLSDRLGRTGSLGILLSGVAVIFVGMMRHDCDVQLPACAAKVSIGDISSYHAVHDVASGATFVFAGVSQLLISGSAQRFVQWGYQRLLSRSSGILTLVLFSLMISGLVPEWVGAIERAIAVIASIWVTALAVALYRLGGQARSPSHPETARMVLATSVSR